MRENKEDFLEIEKQKKARKREFLGAKPSDGVNKKRGTLGKKKRRSTKTKKRG